MRTSPIRRVEQTIGSPCQALATLTLEIYDKATKHAASKGLILADTKFEFGLIDGDDHSCRRGTDPRLLALLAGRDVQPRGTATLLRQAICSRLS